MDYNRVALFVRVVRAGSFTAAAAEVGLPKSSVSRGVSLLEEELGVRLLQRTSRKLSLTEAGHAYYDAVSGSVRAMDEAQEAAREHGAEPRGVVRIAAPPGLNLPAELLTRFQRRYPGLRLEFSFASRYVDLIAEGFDLAVRAGKLEDSSLVVRRIGRGSLAVVGAPAYLRERGRPAAPEDLPAHDWVLYRATGGRSVLALHGPGGVRSVEVAGALVADELGFCQRMVEAGAGLALLPLQLVADALGTGALERVLPAWANEGASVSLVMPSVQQVPARVRLVADFLFEHLQAQLAEFEARCEVARRTGQGRAGRPTRAAAPR